MSQKSTPRRILIFTTAFRPFIGGSELAIEETVQRVSNTVFDIFTPRQKRGLTSLESFGIHRVHRIGLGINIDKFLFPVTGFLASLKLKPKIIHGYQASQASGAAVIYKTFFPKTKFILTLQEGKDLDKQNFIVRYFRNLIIRKADVITAISSHLAEYAKKTNPLAEVLVIPNGVDVDKFKIKNEKLKISDQKTIITVSRLVPKNGVADLIDAFNILETSHQLSAISHRLIIVGDGPLRESLKFRVRSLGLEDRVTMLGEISYDQIPNYLVNADIFVRPSLSEGLGNAFLEAMAVGLPVIGTPVGGITDFIRDGETGVLCRVSDPSDIAIKITNLINNDDLRKKITEGGRLLAESKYNWDYIAKQFENLYARYV